MGRTILLIVFSFAAGILVDAFLFPGYLPRLIDQVSNKPVTQVAATPVPQEGMSSTARVTYEGGKFTPSIVASKKENRLMILNKDKDQLMWLASDSQELSSTRGYGYLEEFVVLFKTSGTFRVTNKLVPSASLTVTVKP